MRRYCLFGLVALGLAAGSCMSNMAGPSAEEVEEDLRRITEQRLRSVVGDWTGTSPVLTLDFTLQQGAGNAVSGSGTMKQAGDTATAPITITGSYQRPQLSLTFKGMVWEGRDVEGSFQGSYTNVSGVDGALRLTGAGYSTEIRILLQEPA